MKVIIIGEFIKLGQFLKKMKMIDSGGQAKEFLERNEIKINSEVPTGKGFKIPVGSTVWVNDDVFYVTNE